ncbi:MAG: alpha/beta hydrolase fold domain-containing protein, partial [Atopobiaceae bacterium]|nr:alpha/beta hydrolase fold domain-containing protein [Atopobiaceae bacterium]
MPGVLWIHGGGYRLGMAGMVHMSRMAPLVAAGEAVAVSPEYRLADSA